MPIISFFGAAARSGRTTAAAAIARGLARLGRQVMLVEAGTQESRLSQWISELDHSSLSTGSLSYCRCDTPEEIDRILQSPSQDDRHVTIFDTSDQISKVRSHVFEVVDLVIMPFICFEDADQGIAHAARHLPCSTYLRGLPIGAPSALSKQVADWMPLIKPALPVDERLTLCGPAEQQFAKEIAAADCNYYDQDDTLANRVIHLSVSACPFVPMAGLPAIKRPKAPALNEPAARLGEPA